MTGSSFGGGGYPQMKSRCPRPAGVVLALGGGGGRLDRRLGLALAVAVSVPAAAGVALVAKGRSRLLSQRSRNTAPHAQLL